MVDFTGSRYRDFRSRTSREELQRASKLKSKLLGINNRDLKTLKVDLQTSLFLC
ncbi:MAG: hypothetical protein EBS06_09240, partial [Proteobacteria bacterium]|nr:hypothetical protein [Pseudomonadota bacterium]